MKRPDRFTKHLTSFILSTVLALSAGLTAGADNTGTDWLEQQDNGVPVVYLTIDESAEGCGTIEEMNQSPDHSVRCTGTVRIDVPDGYTGDYSDTVLSDTDELPLAYVRGRGNVTWTTDKKPYKLKLDKKADLLGMGKNKHWALLANRFDGSMLRNRLVSYIGTRLGLDYTPKMLPVDLVINGEYAGSYFLSETVRIGSSRVDIDELTPEDNTEPNISGGYLLALKPPFMFRPIADENIFSTPS